MTGERPARRYPALAFPEILGVRLAPAGAEAALVNLSATGVLVECSSRGLPGAPMTVLFDGTFTPASIPSRVVRCEVCGIASDGALRFHIGLAFNARIALKAEAEDDANHSPAAHSASSAADGPAPEAAVRAPAFAPPPAYAPVPRNRW